MKNLHLFSSFQTPIWCNEPWMSLWKFKFAMCVQYLITHQKTIDCLLEWRIRIHKWHWKLSKTVNWCAEIDDLVVEGWTCNDMTIVKLQIEEETPPSIAVKRTTRERNNKDYSWKRRSNNGEIKENGGETSTTSTRTMCGDLAHSSINYHHSM